MRRSSPGKLPLITILCCCLALCLIPEVCVCRVIVHDDIVVRGQKVMLKAETRGRVIAEGGQLVEFFVEGETIGKTLSGGDGVAYKKFVPLVSGLHRIEAKSGRHTGRGRLLCLEMGEGIVFVDIEGSLLAKGLSVELRHGAQKAMAVISAKFPVVLLETTFLGKRIVERWVKEKDFPRLVVLPWRQGAVFDRMAKKGLTIKAVIASPKVLESVQGHTPLSFCFETAKKTNKVKNWEAVTKALQ